MTFEQLVPLVEINLREGMDEGKERVRKVKEIFKVMDDVQRYTFYKRSLDLGIRYNKRDLTFTEFMLYAFIKEAFDG